MTEKPVLQRVSEIVADVKQIVSDELQLTIAKIKPEATDGAVGAGLFGAAGVLALNTIPLFGLLFVTLFTWMYSNWLSLFPSIVLGFLTEAVLLLLLAGGLAFVGYGKVKRLKAIQPTIEASKTRLLTTVDLAKASIEAGKEKVAALESSDRPELDSSVR